ncbi:MAG: alpha/beta hydrolase-fold protein, partial [Clostridia bacterium]|nr:alpha/beta hydrolase-fold protein [Clostridia bacterium]
MAFLQASIRSLVLGRNVNITAILPEPYTCVNSRPSGIVSQEPKYKTLYYIPGKGGNELDAILESRIYEYARKKGIAVIMPSLDGIAAVNGPRWNMADFIAHELVTYSRLMFPLSDRREDTYIFGVSLGGYSALYLLFTYPEIFVEGASLSGTVDMVSRVR